MQHFGRFGTPRQLRFDRGPHFIAEVIEIFLSLEYGLTLAYSKKENAIVERFKKEINRHLRSLTFDNISLDNYKRSIPFVQRILNANYSDHLKISSSEMLFGNMLKLDRGIFLKHPERLVHKTLSDYMSKVLAMQDSLLKASAKELLRTATLRLTTKELHKNTVYLPDTYVLVHYRTCSPPTRLHTSWRGPFEGRDFRYTLLDLITLKEKEFRVSDMKPFLFDAALIDPLDVA